MRLSSIPSQVAALALRSPDILALQEVSRGMVEPLRRELSEVGLGYAVDSFTVALSWEEKGPRRFDHAFCSPELNVRACEYLHDLRTEGLSDQSALELDFDI